jgi:photosynthetic reaction center H subunit
MGTVTVPLPASENREPVEIKAERREHFGGAPYSPVGDVLPPGSGRAPASAPAFSDRDAHGNARIVPIGSVPQITVASASIDPRGLSVYGADGARAGTVVDLWIDRAEHMIRYLAVDTGARIVLAPMAMAVMRREGVIISAINAADFANARSPKTLKKSPATRKSASSPTSAPAISMPMPIGWSRCCDRI